jgi:hypothetical protein
MIYKIEDGNDLLAIIISNRFIKPGTHFFTPDHFSQQFAYMHHPKGKIIEPHIHNPVPRKVEYTQEVLFIKSGKISVDFYNDKQHFLESKILESGDAILLIKGGHGFTMIEDVEMYEVKQGPYVGESDKTRFKGIK